MNDEIVYILKRTIVKKIKEDVSLSSLASSLEYKQFKEQYLKLKIEDMRLADDENWQFSKNYLALIDEIQNEINKQIINDDEDYLTEPNAISVSKKIGTVIGTSLLIGSAITYYVYTQQEKKRKSESQNTSIKGKIGVNSGVLQEKISEISNSFIRYNLLLVVPANKLPVDLAIGNTRNDQINELILISVRAYCFEFGDTNGKNILESVECSDTPIDRTTENRVFVQLELLAKPEIMNQQNKSYIINSIKPSSTSKTLQIRNLQSARSASTSTGFYTI